LYSLSLSVMSKPHMAWMNRLQSGHLCADVAGVPS
jgi:hypothetical protein